MKKVLTILGLLVSLCSFSQETESTTKEVVKSEKVKVTTITTSNGASKKQVENVRKLDIKKIDRNKVSSEKLVKSPAKKD